MDFDILYELVLPSMKGFTGGRMTISATVNVWLCLISLAKGQHAENGK